MTETARKKILIVEDDPGIGAFLKTTLRAEGYDVLCTASAEAETLRVLAARR